MPPAHNKIFQRLLHGISANAFGQMVNAFVQITTVPIFLKAWGAGVFGEWIFITSIATYLSMTDMGFSTAAANEMTIMVANAKNTEALMVFQSCFFMISLASGFIFGLCLAVTLALPLPHYLNITFLTEHQAKWIIVTISLGVMIQLQRGLISAGFRCDGHYALGVFISDLIRAIIHCIILTAVFAGITPAYCAGLMVSLQFLGLILMASQLRNKTPWLRHGFRMAKLSWVKALVSPSLASMGLRINRVLGNQGIITIIGIFLGGYAVSVFTTIRTLCRFAFQALNIVYNAVMPEISAAWGSKRPDLVRKLHRHSFRLCFWVLIASLAFLFVFGGRIYVVWTRNQLPLKSDLFHLMLLVTLANGLWYASSVVPIALNRHLRVAKWNLVLTLASIAASVYGIRILRLNGVALSLLLGDICMILVVIPETLAILRERYRLLIFNTLRPPIYLIADFKRYVFRKNIS